MQAARPALVRHGEDHVPESIIFGIQIGTGFPISASFLAAVFISNTAAEREARRRYWPEAVALRQDAAKSLIKSQSEKKKPGAKTKRTAGESKPKGGDAMFRRVPGSTRQ